MEIESKEFIEIVQGGFFLSEYLKKYKETDLNLETNNQDDLKGSENFKNWCEKISGENKKLFLRRLAFDKLDHKKAEKTIESPVIIKDLPLWAKTMADVCNSIKKGQNYKDRPQFIDPKNPVPFEDLLFPAVENRSKKLNKKIKHLDLPIDSKTFIPMERMLLKQLSAIASEPLMEELRARMSIGQSMLSKLLSDRNTDTGNKNYNNLVNDLGRSGMLDLFKKYPVLGRLMAVKTDQWLDTMYEFASRLHKDLNEIKKTFLLTDQDYLIKRVEPTWSDPHHEGRSSFILFFTSGKRILYKPRNHDLEEAYSSFIKWCMDKKPNLYLTIPEMLRRKSHAWVDYVKKKEITSKKELSSYYRRMGNLTAFIYALSGADMHNENIKAGGEYPVPIDLELLCCGIPALMNEKRKKKNLNPDKMKSILDLGILPQWQSGSDGRVLNETGAIALKKSESSRHALWKKINTDSMEIGFKEVKTSDINSLPLKSGENIPVKGFEKDVEKGFKDAYEFLLEHRDSIFSKEGPAEAFKKCSSRFIFRDTRIYSSLLSFALKPKNLKSGIDFGIALETLYRSFLHEDEKPINWLMAKSETSQLEKLDIPRFTICVNEASLDCEKTSIPVQEYSGWEVLNFRFKNLSKKDLKHQSDMLNQSLKSMSAVNHEKNIYKNSQNRLLKHADFCANQLIKRKIEDKDGKPNWLCVYESAGGAVLREMNHSLYKGKIGPILFLSAFAHETGDQNLGELVIKASDINPEKIVSDLKVIGGANGIGSVIYALTKISGFTKSEKPMKTAEKLVPLITPQLIDKDEHLDVLNGSAGAILGLISYFKSSKDQLALDLAVKCGNRLVNYQCEKSGGWEYLGKQPLTGFSHGAAGISLALARLFSLTNDQTYLEAAIKGIDYEKSVFSISESNWPDFRNPKKDPVYLSNWCNGAPGIGLARLGCLGIIDDDLIKDIDAALKSTKISADDSADFWCCGNFGRIEFLLALSEKLSRPKLRIKAIDLALEISSKRTDQAFGWKLSRNQFEASIFTGIAGIGYSFLRMLNPTKYPSILLWE